MLTERFVKLSKDWEIEELVSEHAVKDTGVSLIPVPNFNGVDWQATALVLARELKSSISEEEAREYKYSELRGRFKGYKELVKQQRELLTNAKKNMEESEAARTFQKSLDEREITVLWERIEGLAWASAFLGNKLQDLDRNQDLK